MKNIVQDIKSVLEFYQAMGIERIPIQIDLRSRRAEEQKQPPIPPW